MRLDQELVRRRLCESRQEAQFCIENNFVLINGIFATKLTTRVNDSTVLEVTQHRKFVSRGGDKLEGAFMHIHGSVVACVQAYTNKVSLDVGSSTGGFTDCLLSYGVSEVTSVDVGTSQLHNSLRANNQVHLFENKDIRTFETEILFDLIVVDLSFISLSKVIDKIIMLGKTNSEFYFLVKPQFEVGYGNTKKGIVKDTALVENILTSYQSYFLNNNFYGVQIFPCSIQGGDGNQEFFMYVRKSA